MRQKIQLHKKLQPNLLKNYPLTAKKQQSKRLFLPTSTFFRHLSSLLRPLEQEFEDRSLNTEFRYDNYLISPQFIKNCPNVQVMSWAQSCWKHNILFNRVFERYRQKEGNFELSFTYIFNLGGSTFNFNLPLPPYCMRGLQSGTNYFTVIC